MSAQSSPPNPKPAQGRKILRKVLTVLAVLIIVIGVAGFILFGYSPVPPTSTYPLDITKIRQLAQADSSLLPTHLNVMIIGEGAMPRFLVTAGGGLGEMTMPVPVFQVVYPDGTVIVDTGMDRASFDQMFAGGSFSNMSYDRLQDAMRQSRTILLTHEHLDHLAGLTHSPYLDELVPKILLTREQINAITTGAAIAPDAAFTPALLARLTPLVYDQYHLVAPGLVLVKAAGHSPGSQMVYLRLQNGSEFLLVGDVVWSMQSLTRLTGRPIAMSLLLQEDRSAILNQARSLYNLSQTEPVNLLISHDYGQIDSYIQRGLVGNGF